MRERTRTRTQSSALGSMQRMPQRALLFRSV
jgi:hypothetical protein